MYSQRAFMPYITTRTCYPAGSDTAYSNGHLDSSYHPDQPPIQQSTAVVVEQPAAAPTNDVPIAAPNTYKPP